MKKLSYKEAGKKTFNNFKQVLPMLFGMVLLVNFVIVMVPAETYSSLFSGNMIIDPIIGAISGSIATGNPITGYIIGGELQKSGVSLVAITAFLLSWVTVGIIQFPAESMMLGKKFAITRNIVSFVTSIIVAVLTVLTLGVLS